MTTFTKNFDLYFTREAAVKGINKGDYMLFAKDKNTTDSRKTFMRLPISEFNHYLDDILIENRNFYEILPPDFPVKPYFDLEMEYVGLSYETCKENLELFINWVITEIKSVFNMIIVRTDFIILDSCRENKLSFHLIIQNKIYFASVIEHKKFIAHILSRFFNPINDLEDALFAKLSYKNGIRNLRIFDDLPYGTFQNIRLVNQSKKGKAYILKNKSQYSNKDTLIRLYEGVGDRTVLDVNNLLNSKKNVKSVSKSVSKSISRSVSKTEKKQKKKTRRHINICKRRRNAYAIKKFDYQ
jgi:hypothetical protein